ncbi:hypothetical protein Tco_1200960 [Tanacetum coccineum]
MDNGQILTGRKPSFLWENVKEIRSKATKDDKPRIEDEDVNAYVYWLGFKVQCEESKALNKGAGSHPAQLSSHPAGHPAARLAGLAVFGFLCVHGYSDDEFDADDPVTLISRLDISNPLYLHPNDFVALMVFLIEEIFKEVKLLLMHPDQVSSNIESEKCVHGYSDDEFVVDDPITLISRLDISNPLYLHPNDFAALMVTNMVGFKSEKCYEDWLGHPAVPVLNVLKKSLEIDNKDQTVLYEICQRAKQTRELFPLGDGFIGKLYIKSKRSIFLDQTASEDNEDVSEAKCDDLSNGGIAEVDFEQNMPQQFGKSWCSREHCSLIEIIELQHTVDELRYLLTAVCLDATCNKRAELVSLKEHAEAQSKEIMQRRQQVEGIMMDIATDSPMLLGHHAVPGLNVLKKSLEIDNKDQTVLYEICQRAKQTRELFPLG